MRLFVRWPAFPGVDRDVPIVRDDGFVSLMGFLAVSFMAAPNPRLLPAQEGWPHKLVRCLVSHKRFSNVMEEVWDGHLD